MLLYQVMSLPRYGTTSSLCYGTTSKPVFATKTDEQRVLHNVY
jgi:hypothetical protein